MPFVKQCPGQRVKVVTKDFLGCPSCGNTIVDVGMAAPYRRNIPDRPMYKDAISVIVTCPNNCGMYAVVGTAIVHPTDRKV